MSKFIKKISRKRGLPPGSLVHVGEKKTERARITIIDYDKTQFQDKEAKKVEECCKAVREQGPARSELRFRVSR